MAPTEDGTLRGHVQFRPRRPYAIPSRLCVRTRGATYGAGCPRKAGVLLSDQRITRKRRLEFSLEASTVTTYIPGLKTGDGRSS